MTDSIKNPTTYEQQLAKLKSRGCTTKDDTFCIAVLKTVNYYRLSAYFLPFKNSDDTYAEGTSFEQEIHSNRNLPFVRHHAQKYDGMFPTRQDLKLKVKININFGQQYGR